MDRQTLRLPRPTLWAAHKRTIDMHSNAYEIPVQVPADPTAVTRPHFLITNCMRTDQPRRPSRRQASTNWPQRTWPLSMNRIPIAIAPAPQPPTSSIRPCWMAPQPQKPVAMSIAWPWSQLFTCPAVQSVQCKRTVHQCAITTTTTTTIIIIIVTVRLTQIRWRVQRTLPWWTDLAPWSNRNRLATAAAIAAANRSRQSLSRWQFYSRLSCSSWSSSSNVSWWFSTEMYFIDFWILRN